MAIVDEMSKTISSVGQQPKEIVKVMLNPDNSIAVGSCFTDKAIVLDALLQAIKAVALSIEAKTDTIIKPTAGQVLKINN